MTLTSAIVHSSSIGSSGSNPGVPQHVPHLDDSGTCHLCPLDRLRIRGGRLSCLRMASALVSCFDCVEGDCGAWKWVHGSMGAG